jgi:hypothetical protein
MRKGHMIYDLQPFLDTSCFRGKYPRKKPLPIGHFLGHIEQQLTIFVVGLA